MHDGSDDRKYDKETQKTEDSICNVTLFHGSCSCQSLTDLYREGNHDDDGEHIEERNDHSVSAPRQPQEERMQDADQYDTDDSNHQKVQFLIGEARLDGVVPRQYEVVYTSDQRSPE